MADLPTLGVEEEFLLVDRTSCRPVSRAAAVITAARAVLGDHVEPELFPTQIETNTRPVTAARELRRELASLRRSVVAAAADTHCRVIASGTAVIPALGPIRVTREPRYRRIARQLGQLADEQGEGVCGCHVHLGMEDRDTAVAVSNHLRPYLPVVEAIAANSPFRDGRDSGYADWRAVRWGRWPTVGPAPLFADAAAYDELADRLVRSGTLFDRGMIYWHARLSETFPTLEIRVADTSADLDTTVLVATLLRGLATTALADVADGRPAPGPCDELMRAAHWRAAHDGLAGHGVDVRTGDLVPAHDLAVALVDRAAPGLEAAGDLGAVRSGLARLRTVGDGATVQRQLFARRGRLRDVVDGLAAATGPAGEPDVVAVPS